MGNENEEDCKPCNGFSDDGYYEYCGTSNI